MEFLKNLDNHGNINCYVVNLYKVSWLTEVSYLFGLVFFAKKANLGCFCNTQIDYGVRQQDQASQSFWDTSWWRCIRISIHFFPNYQSTFTNGYKWIQKIQMECNCSEFLIMPGSCSYNNCWVLIFDLVYFHTLVSERKLKCIFFNLKNTNRICNTITS